jgi:hypothetical protein
VGVGLSISALSLNMQQAMLYTFLLIMPLMLLSGLLTPVRNMPEVLQIATYVNPLRFGMNIVRRVYLEGARSAISGASSFPCWCWLSSRCRWRPGCSATVLPDRGIRMSDLLTRSSTTLRPGGLCTRPVARRLCRRAGFRQAHARRTG